MKFKKLDMRSNLEKEIDSVLDQMSKLDKDSKEYTAMANNLQTLYNVRSKDKDQKIKPDTVAMVVCNLVGIGMILWHEKADVITTKALGFVMRGRV